MAKLTERTLLKAFERMLGDPRCKVALVVGETSTGIPVEIWLDPESDVSTLFRHISGFELKPGAHDLMLEAGPRIADTGFRPVTDTTEPTFEVLSRGNNAAFEIIEHGTGTVEPR